MFSESSLFTHVAVRFHFEPLNLERVIHNVQLLFFHQFLHEVFDDKVIGSWKFSLASFFLW